MYVYVYSSHWIIQNTAELGENSIYGGFRFTGCSNRRGESSWVRKTHIFTFFPTSLQTLDKLLIRHTAFYSISKTVCPHAEVHLGDKPYTIRLKSKNQIKFKRFKKNYDDILSPSLLI